MFDDVIDMVGIMLCVAILCTVAATMIEAL